MHVLYLCTVSLVHHLMISIQQLESLGQEIALGKDMELTLNLVAEKFMIVFVNQVQTYLFIVATVFMLTNL